MVLLILFCFDYFISRAQKKLAKITAKSKKKKNKTIVKDRCFRFQNWVYQNASNEVLSARLKFQAKIPTRSGVLWKSD